MLRFTKGGTLTIGNETTDYITFGSGSKALVMLAGLSDGLKTVKGSAVPFAMMYGAFSKKYTVYVFSRKNQLTAGYSTRDMAQDVKRDMDELGIASAAVMGVSMGGMIAQYLALDFPERVKKLVLAVTLSRPNDVARAAVETWIELARSGDYRGLMADTAEKTYSEEYLRRNRLLLPLLGLVGKPDDFTRFIIEAEACLAHNAYESLSQLRCPALILGGGKDKIVGAEASKEIASKIVGSELYIYDELGHAAYEEAKDFNERVLSFLNRQ